MFRVLEKSKENKTKFSKILNVILIALTIFLLLFSVATLIYRFHDYQKYFIFKGIGSLYLFSIFFKIIHHNFFQQKKGTFSGDLTFKDNEISVLNKNFPLDEIAQIRIKGNDIKGEFTGLRSQGINNELIIKLINGDDVNYFFEQTKENKLQDISVLKNYVDKGKLAQSNYDSIIENTNYY